MNFSSQKVPWIWCHTRTGDIGRALGRVKGPHTRNARMDGGPYTPLHKNDVGLHVGSGQVLLTTYTQTQTYK